METCCKFNSATLKPESHSKLPNKFLSLHYNACPYTTAQTVETLNQVRFELQEHAAYFSDLATSYYPIFESLKEGLRGHRFSTDADVKESGYILLHHKK